MQRAGRDRAGLAAEVPSFDVLATNGVAAALLSPFENPDVDSLNMVRVLFLHDQAKAVFVDWELVTRVTVHALRLTAGLDPSDTRITSLVDEMLGVEEFRLLWRDQAVGGLARAYKVFVHPDVGRIELTYQTFDVTDAPGQQLLVGTPAAGSASQSALTSWAPGAPP